MVALFKRYSNHFSNPKKCLKILEKKKTRRAVELVPNQIEKSLITDIEVDVNKTADECNSFW